MDSAGIIMILCGMIITEFACVAVILTRICDNIEDILRHLDVKKKKDKNDY